LEKTTAGENSLFSGGYSELSRAKIPISEHNEIMVWRGLFSVVEGKS